MKNNHTSFRVQAHAITDKGRRPNNEDFVTSFEPTDLQERQKSGCIYIVADGVGGASVGERASQYAAEKVLYEYSQHPEIAPGPRLKQVIAHVNREIHKYAQDKGIRMATTMTVAVVLDNALIAANVGDSRVYLVRRDEVSQITQDHNIVGEMVRDGVVTEAEALKNKAKNRLTRSIGGEEEVHVDIFGPIPLQAGDKIVLCSDGLTRYALKEDIANLTASGSAEEITESLVAFAKDRGRGGADNISVITVAYEPAAGLEALIPSPRPEAPEQPWEILETNIPPKPQPARRLSRKWIALSASSLGIIFIATTALLIAFMPKVLAFMGTASTRTPTLTITPLLSPTLSPTTITSATSSATPGTSSPPTVVQTTPPVPALTFVDCSKTIDRLNVRDHPSELIDSKILKTLGCEEVVDLNGRYVPIKNPERDWYQIRFTDEVGNSTLGWVIANRVSVPPEHKANIPLLDYSGMTVTPAPQPQGTTPAPGTTQISTPGDCIYTVKAGDVLSIIAQKFGVADAKSIACKADSSGCDLTDPDQIQLGWQVIIPGITADACIQQGGQVPAN